MAEPAEPIVLDAYAVLSVLGDEPGADEVAGILSNPAYTVFINAINVGEVTSIVLRRHGPEEARKVEDAIYDHPRIQVAGATRERIRAAAELKAGAGLSLADAFAAALALELGAELVTGDPEFESLVGRGLRLRRL